MYSSLDIDPAHYGTQIVVARPSGRDLDAQHSVLSSRGWGIDSTGEPYFDPAGASVGEVAALGFDGATQSFFLFGHGRGAEMHLLAGEPGAMAARSARDARAGQARPSARPEGRTAGAMSAQAPGSPAPLPLDVEPGTPAARSARARPRTGVRAARPADPAPRKDTGDV